MRGQPGHNTQPHAPLQPSFRGIDAWITSKLNDALFCKLRVSLMCLADIFDMSPMVVVHTGPGRRPVDWCRKLNVCTVHVFLNQVNKNNWYILCGEILIVKF